MPWMQPFIAQVTLTHCHLASTPFAIIFINGIVVTPSAAHPWNLRIIVWRYFEMLAVHVGESCNLALIQTHQDEHTDVQANITYVCIHAHI